MGVVVALAPLGETPVWLISGHDILLGQFHGSDLGHLLGGHAALDLVHHGVDLLICRRVAARELFQGLPERQQLFGLVGAYGQVGVFQFERADQQLRGA